MHSLSKREKRENNKEKPDQHKPETHKQTKSCSCGQQWVAQSSSRPGWSHPPASMAEAYVDILLADSPCSPRHAHSPGVSILALASLGRCQVSSSQWLLAGSLTGWPAGCPLRPGDASVALRALHCACLQSQHHMDSRTWTLWIKARVTYECLNPGDSVVLWKQNENEGFRCYTLRPQG